MMLLFHRHCSLKFKLYRFDHFQRHTRFKTRTHCARSSHVLVVFLPGFCSLLLLQSLCSQSRTRISDNHVDTAERVSQFDMLRAQAETSGETGFGSLQVSLSVFSILKDRKEMERKCNSVSLEKPPGFERKMSCKVEKEVTDAFNCVVTVKCMTKFDLRGDVALPIALPVEFQTMNWTASTVSGEYFDPVTTAEHGGDIDGILRWPP